MPLKIGVISLGCAKNRVDTEVILGILKSEGHTFVQDMDEADVALINTCAFVDDAKEESIDTILDAEQQRKFKKLRGIIVTGCLPQRFQKDVKGLFPRVDAFLGTAAYKDIREAVAAVERGERYLNFADLTMTEEFGERILTTQKPTAYVKIAEGCDNRCSYCVIPQIRGGFQSRTPESVLEEITALAKEGYSEIVLVSQDTTHYGQDLEEQASLADLMDRAAQIEGVKWLRALYFYPNDVTDELLDVMMKHDNIVKYIDIPIQHTEDSILKAMNRRYDYAALSDTIKRIRSASPDFVLRSTVIIGFPGEDRMGMGALSKKLKEMGFNHLGVFAYSQEEGTPAANMQAQVDDAEKEFRRDAVMNLQAPVSYELNQARIGMEPEALVEGKDNDTDLYYGRIYAQAPEVDGKTVLHAKGPLEIGAYYPVKIINAYHYDFVADVME